MSCKRCRSEIQSMFAAEINIHFPGRNGLTKPAVMASPKLVVCLVCGFAEFQIDEDELLKLVEGTHAP